MNKIEEMINEQIKAIKNEKTENLKFKLRLLEENGVREVLGGINNYFFNGKGEISDIIPKNESDKESNNDNVTKIKLGINFIEKNNILSTSYLAISVGVVENKNEMPELLLSYDNHLYRHSDLIKNPQKRYIEICNVTYPKNMTNKNRIKEELIKPITGFIFNDRHYPFNELSEEILDYLKYKVGPGKYIEERISLDLLPKLSNGSQLEKFLIK
jgi:hypothetical protein